MTHLTMVIPLELGNLQWKASSETTEKLLTERQDLGISAAAA